MKKLIKCFFIAALLFSFQSCIDKEYNLDDIVTQSKFNIPPVPLGSIDTIFINLLSELPEIPEIPPGFEFPGINVAYSYTIENLFDEDGINRFFTDGSGDVILETTAILHLLRPEDGINAVINLEIWSEDSYGNTNPIREIKIPSLKLVRGENKNIQIKIAAEYMKYMKDAKHLHMSILLNSSSISLDQKKNYIFFNDIVLTSGGYFFNF